ncbi:MAG: HAMP domain-containing histidine kinase, partial [Chloroflexi bacterium]
KTGELNRLVSDLLEASRTEARAFATVTSRLDLGQLVQQAVERARPRADLAGAEIATRVPTQPVIVEADAAQVGRILDNLLNNAMTYNLSSPRVDLTVSTANDQAAVRVADNGVGIPALERERIFEQFHRNNEPSFINVPGTGLGLYISRQLAEANGGTLALESSSPQAGTVFLLSLPAVPKTAEAVAADDVLASVGEAVRADALAAVER